VIAVATTGRRGQTPDPIIFQFCHRFQQPYNYGFLKITCGHMTVIKNT
jgi:hypothetical protein